MRDSCVCRASVLLSGVDFVWRREGLHVVGAAVLAAPVAPLATTLKDHETFSSLIMTQREVCPCIVDRTLAVLTTPGAIRSNLSSRIRFRSKTDPNIERRPVNLFFLAIHLCRDGIQMILVQAKTHCLTNLIARKVRQLHRLLRHMTTRLQIHAVNRP